MADEIPLPEVSRDDAKFIVDSVEGSQQSIDYGLYSKIFSYTKHYNYLKMRYKTSVISWLLATFIGFGYVLAGKVVEDPVNKMITIAFIAIFSSRGILKFLLLDTEVYHRLLNSSFLANLEMETEGRNKSRTYRNMMKALLPERDPSLDVDSYHRSSFVFRKFRNLILWLFNENKDDGLDPVFYDAIYYCSICFFLWMVAGFSVSVYLYPISLMASIMCFIGTPILSLMLSIKIIKRVLSAGIDKFKVAE